MEIVILGTSAVKPLPRIFGKKMRGLPRENCHCPICQSKNKKDRRMRSSILVNDQFLIDCGPDILEQIRNSRRRRGSPGAAKFEIRNLRAIFITHRHSDHIAGLKKIASPRLVGLGPKNLFLYISKIDAEILSKKVLSRFKVKIIKPFQKIRIVSPRLVGLGPNNLIFQPIPVIHPGSKNTFAFKIICNSYIRKKLVFRSLMYMPDYKKIPKKSLKYFYGIDCLILGGASLEKPLFWHAPIVDSLKLAKKLKPKKVYFTHIGHHTLPHQELIKFVQKTGGKNFDICFDGQRIKI